jgi:hypothetical protein
MYWHVNPGKLLQVFRNLRSMRVPIEGRRTCKRGSGPYTDRRAYEGLYLWMRKLRLSGQVDFQRLLAPGILKLILINLDRAHLECLRSRCHDAGRDA